MLYRSQVSSLGLLLSFAGQLGRLHPLRDCVWCLEATGYYAVYNRMTPFVTVQ